MPLMHELQLCVSRAGVELVTSIQRSLITLIPNANEELENLERI